MNKFVKLTFCQKDVMAMLIDGKSLAKQRLIIALGVTIEKGILCVTDGSKDKESHV